MALHPDPDLERPADRQGKNPAKGQAGKRIKKARCAFMQITASLCGFFPGKPTN
jgi:hypothetical protein